MSSVARSGTVTAVRRGRRRGPPLDGHPAASSGRSRRDRAAGLGLALVVAVARAWALVGPFVIPGDPNGQELADALSAAGLAGGRASATQPLGTDHLGRDMLVRIVYGARTSMVIGVLGGGAGQRRRLAGRRSSRPSGGAASTRC